MAVVRLAYRFALDPTPGQERALRSHAGAARFAWNWGLHQCRQRIASVRADALHKATSMFAARYETVVAEDLNVAGMTRNRKLARAVGDQGFGRLRRMLGYKVTWRGGTLLTADRFYPSSKKCVRHEARCCIAR